MARIQPFPAYRYDLSKVRADEVLTQPYDKITPELRRRYLERSPYNLVRIILGEKQPADDDTRNVYSRAHELLEAWEAGGVLRPDPEPAVYPYTQTFRAPGAAREQTRRGFIGLCALEDYGNRVVFRHEQTLSGPKLDRLNLLRATRTHAGQIFVLYSDPAQATEAELLGRAQSPVLESTDELGTHHRLFRESDAGVIDRLCQAMTSRPLIIADGHHRYETALAWRHEQRTRAPHRANAPWDWVMMTFVNLDAPGLVVLPTHRLVHGLSGFEAAAAAKRLGEWFESDALPADWETARAALAESAARGEIALAVALAGETGMRRLRLRAQVDLARELPEALPEQRQLDVLLLHELALHRSLGITPEAVREERNLRYVRDPHEALQSVRDGNAQAAFFLHPIAAGQVRDVALAGGVMPQKSTDFYPKLLSGLTLYKVD